MNRREVVIRTERGNTLLKGSIFYHVENKYFWLSRTVPVTHSFKYGLWGEKFSEIVRPSVAVFHENKSNVNSIYNILIVFFYFRKFTENQIKLNSVLCKKTFYIFLRISVLFFLHNTLKAFTESYGNPFNNSTER